MFNLRKSTAQKIPFVMLDFTGAELSGIPDLTVEISKNGGAFAAGAGTKAEIGDGWYSYNLTAGETDTPGPLSIRVTGTGALVQNLAYSVETLIVGAVQFTYTLTDSSSNEPIEGVSVWFTTDSGGTNVVWQGETDTFGVARDGGGSLPYLAAGTYFVWRSKVGYVFTDPDQEEVS